MFILLFCPIGSLLRATPHPSLSPPPDLIHTPRNATTPRVHLLVFPCFICLRWHQSHVAFVEQLNIFCISFIYTYIYIFPPSLPSFASSLRQRVHAPYLQRPLHAISQTVEGNEGRGEGKVRTTRWVSKEHVLIQTHHNEHLLRE